MNFVIAVFGSRSETLSYVNMLRRNGVGVGIVQTPKEAGRTCGISARFMYKDFQVAKMILSKSYFSSFQGFFIEQNSGEQKNIFRG